MYFFERNNFSKAETYSEPCQTNKMDHFAKKSQRLLVVNYFCKTFHLRCFDRILNTPLKGIPKWLPKKSPGQSCSALHTIKAWYFETLKPRKIFETFLRKTVMEQFMIYYETQKLANHDLLNLQQSCTILKGKRLHQTQAMFFWITDKKFYLFIA